MDKDIVKFFKNPKVQLGISLLSSILLAVAFFGQYDIPYDENAVKITKGVDGKTTILEPPSQTFFIATLSPMAAGFALIPFIISILGIGISLIEINKQNKEKNTQKAIERYKFIDEEKSRLNGDYQQEFGKLLNCQKSDGAPLSNPANLAKLSAIRKFIDDDQKKPDEKIDSVSPTTYEEVIREFSAMSSALKLRELKAEIKAYEEVEKIDLSIEMSDKSQWGCGWIRSGSEGIRTQFIKKSSTPGIKVKVVSKLAGAKSRTP
jgi:hypothetical protein